jgi:hypothetical protein
MNLKLRIRSSLALALFACGTFGFAACGGVFDDEAKDLKDTVSATVQGLVTDNHGKPVAGAKVRLYSLLDNTNFVTDTDVGSLKAQIDKEAVLASDNDLRSVVTGADGRFRIKELPNAFLAVATLATCSAGYAGFDEDTGVLSVDTLIKPKLSSGLSFEIPTFVLACAEPPSEVEPEGNTPDCPPFEPEPPPPPPPCTADSCAGAFGHCEETACIITCTQESCEASGGNCSEGKCVVPPKCDATACQQAGGNCSEDQCIVPPKCDATACQQAGGSCMADECVTPSCNASECAAARGSCSADGNSCVIPPCFATEAECTAARGSCSADGNSCVIPPCFATEAECAAAGGKCSQNGASCDLPACKSDADCEKGGLGSWCENAGDIALAKCQAPDPGEIPPLPPMEMQGWSELRITDAAGKLLADASSADARIAGKDIPEDGIVRVHAKFGGSAETAYVHLQSGSKRCAKLRPRTDFFEADIEDGALVSEDGDYVELMLHGGCQKLQLSTSNVLGQGERSFVVDIGDSCAPPRDVFVAILTYDGGRRQRADLDLNVWDQSGELVHVGRRRARWGWLRRHGRGGPEVFIGQAASDGPFTIKVTFFSGRPRDVHGKVRILRFANGTLRDETFRFTVRKPKDVAEIGVFSVE